MLETSPGKVADGVEILTFNIFENDISFYFERKITSMLQMLQTVEYLGLSKQNTTVMTRNILL